jgi:LytS/YehU family sensor histidine kinase
MWITAVLIYVLIPRYLNTAGYLRFVLFYAIALYLGIFIMEVVIEDETDIMDALSWFAIEHEGPEILAVSGLIATLKVVIDYGQRQNQMIKLQKENAETEAMFLKSQLNPHVLFNNLNNLYSFALHKSEHTAPMILKLSEIMRYMLYEANQDRVRLAKELNYVENYIELQKIQLEGRGDIIYEVHGSAEKLQIAPMMLISFIENCFKHSAETKTDGLRVIIRVEIREGKIDLYTENSFEKPESDQTDQLQVGGIGLKNVERRLELIYPEKHQLIVKELTQLYIVNLSIDLQ